MDTLNIDWAFTPEQVDLCRALKSHSGRERFTLGPIPHRVLARARAAHKDGPLVLLAIKAARDISVALGDDEEIAVTQAVCAQIGVPRNSKLRAIRALEEAGLLTVSWHPYRAPRVKLPPRLFELKMLRSRPARTPGPDFPVEEPGSATKKGKISN
jgi:hypothetical protein